MEAKNKAVTKITKPDQKKQIEITEIKTITREDDLLLKVGFRLLSSKTAFSKVTSELFFNEQKISTLRLRILQGPLGTDGSEFSSVLSMIWITEGQHCLKVEMHEIVFSEEKIASTSKQILIKYTPLRKEDQVVKLPIIRRVAGAELAVISNREKTSTGRYTKK